MMDWLTLIIFICVITLLIFLGIYQLYRRKIREYPRPPLRAPEVSPQLEEWDEHGLFIAWVGHSTMLMRIQGLYILTDPVFSVRVGVKLPFVTVGPKRHVQPALEVESLPPIDVVLLSHAHLDHLDLPSLRRVIGPSTRVITAPNTSLLVGRAGAKSVQELEPGESVVLDNGLEVIGQQVQHWGNRFPWNNQQGYQGYVLKRGPWCVFFAGDTAFTEEIAKVKIHNPQVTCMPIGAYAPETYQGAHCTPEQAWQMYESTGADYLVPIHHDTFVLSREPVDEPLIRLIRAAGMRSSEIVIRRQGETFSLQDPSHSPIDKSGIDGSASI